MAYDYTMILVGICIQGMNLRSPRQCSRGSSQVSPLLRIHDNVTPGDLTTRQAGLKYRKFQRKLPPDLVSLETLRIYDLKVDPSCPKP